MCYTCHSQRFLLIERTFPSRLCSTIGAGCWRLSADPPGTDVSPNGSHSLKGHTRPVRGGTAFNPSHRDSVRDGPVAEPGDGGLLERGCLTRRVKGQSVRFAYRLTVLTSDNSGRQGRHGASSASARVRVPPLNVFQPIAVGRYQEECQNLSMWKIGVEIVLRSFQ